jgi:hypothetical protein
MTTPAVIPERLEKLQSIHLRKGGGPKPNGEVDGCVMQLTSYIAGEPWTDHPACVSPALTAFCIVWNDALPDEDRDRLLKPFIPRLVGTAGAAADEEKRAWMATDWLARTFAPAWLRLAKLDEHAAALETLPALETDELADAAMAVLSAAESAAESAARSAARSAAESAAWSAARSAADKALAPTVKQLQDSAVELLERMIAVGQPVAEAVA